MAMSEVGEAYLRGTSRGLPPGQDYDYFCESICEVYVGVLPQRPDHEYPADFALYDLGATRLGLLSAPGGPAVRDRHSLSQSPDDGIFLNFSRSSWELEHLGRQWTVPAGTPWLLDNSESYRLTFDPTRRMSLYTIRFPRASLGDPGSGDVRRINDRITTTEAGRHFTAQAGLLAAMVDLHQLDTASAMAGALVGLVNAVAGAGDEHPVDRLGVFKLAARSQLTNPAYTIASLARDFSCSIRTIQTAFGERGETFSDWFAVERLELARERLASAAWSSRSIAQIATSVGFADVSTFHRHFRSRFGTTPAKLR
ncbi:helix-turn-helix transcriptional regulator [Naasia lichenicola]|uniref:Helix-turn-helix domain-containing protein n=1 Tax=Naasia lichenicola TaxID=2565933 RepID=A0A4S4FGD0_9MICO|nr:AraC family transcriptional regulator [Naasia lichenicola]THG29299.1 helix-turn-helix domain-containing protein [Naasia lichenicola]